MAFEVIRTDSKNSDFHELIKSLDQDLWGRYGELQKLFAPHNKIDFIQDVVLVYKNKVPVACGAFKEYNVDSVEMKRIFVAAAERRQGLAKRILQELENAAREKGYRNAVLETGNRQFEAIQLYKSIGYTEIPNYEPYGESENSVCMRKVL